MKKRSLGEGSEENPDRMIEKRRTVRKTGKK